MLCCVLLLTAALKSTIAIMEDGFIGAHPFMEETKDEDEEDEDDGEGPLSTCTYQGRVTAVRRVERESRAVLNR